MSLDIEINSKQYSLVSDRDGSKISTRPVQQFVQPIRDTGRTRPEDVAAYESFVVPNLSHGFGRARINSDVAFDPREYRRFFNSTCDTRWMDRIYLPILPEDASQDSDLHVLKASASFNGELNALWSTTSIDVINKQFTGSSTDKWEGGGYVEANVVGTAYHFAAGATSQSYTNTSSDLLVIVALGQDSGNTINDPAPSYSGAALTKIVSNTNTDGDSERTFAGAWYKASPATGTNNITWSAWQDAGGGNVEEPTFVVYSISGVDPSNLSIASTSSDIDDTTTVSNTLTTEIGDIVIDGYSIPDDATNTLGANQTLGGSNSNTDSHTHVSSYERATTTSTAMTHSFAGPGNETGASMAIAIKSNPAVPLDLIQDKTNLVALLASEDDHKVSTSTDGATWTAATTQITAGLLTDGVTQNEDIDAGLLASIGAELVAAVWDETSGTITFFSSTNAGVVWADESIEIASQNGPQGLQTYIGIDGESKLYLGTSEGLYEIDTSPSTWTFELLMPMPNSTHNCRRMTIHEGSLWFAQGVDNDSPAPIYKLTVQGNSRIIEPGFGLSYGDGVPSDMLGPVRWMKSAGDQLFIAVGGGAASRNARVLAWNGFGWHSMAKFGSANQKIDWLDIGSGDDGVPRLHYGVRNTPDNTGSAARTDAYFLEQPLVNPRSGVTIKREGDGQFIELPYYDLGMPHNSKNFLAAHISADDLTASHETVEFHYGINGEDRDDTDLGDFTSAVSKLQFASGAGVSAKDIGIMLKLNRNDSTNTNTPKIKDIIIEGLVVPTILYEHQMTIDLQQTAEETGQSVETVISNIETLVESVIQTQAKFGQVSKYVTLDRERSAFSFQLNSWDASGAPNSMADRTGTFNLVLVEKVAS